jgi:hypothetical protein
MNIEFMIPIIARDFKVDLISRNENCLFYSAMRSDIWHFVHAIVSETENGTHTNFKQWHIPRYVMAKAMEYIRITDEFDPPLFHDLIPDFPIAITPDRKVRFALRAINEGLPEEYSKSLEVDIPALKKSRDAVRERDGLYTLPRAKTAFGNPVVDESRGLIEAIAFERITRKKLDDKKFGIYSAYCTQTDFSSEQRHPFAEIDRLMTYQFSFEHDDLPDAVLKAVMESQSEFLGKHIWGPGIEIDKDTAAEVFLECLSRFKNRYSTQFTLMIGMHNPSIFLPIAHIYNVITSRQYVEWMTSGYQPDSNDEQFISTSTAFIELFGSL